VHALDFMALAPINDTNNTREVFILCHLEVGTALGHQIQSSWLVMVRLQTGMTRGKTKIHNTAYVPEQAEAVP
jgi:hypothetical protein